MVLSGFSTIQSDSSKLVGAATWAGSVTTRQTRVGDVPTVALPRSRTIQPDLNSNCRARAHSVSPPLTLRLDFSKPGLTGRHFNHKLTSWNVNRLCWSRNGKDGGKKKKKRNQQSGHWVKRVYLGFFYPQEQSIIVIMQERTSSSSRSSICHNEDHLDYNISHCHSNSTICSFHGESCEKRSPHTGTCQQSWIFSIELRLQ